MRAMKVKGECRKIERKEKGEKEGKMWWFPDEGHI